LRVGFTGEGRPTQLLGGFDFLLTVLEQWLVHSALGLMLAMRGEN
jgi:hypothetical protein